jgi:hypothetical protein
MSDPDRLVGVEGGLAATANADTDGTGDGEHSTQITTVPVAYYELDVLLPSGKKLKISPVCSTDTLSLIKQTISEFQECLL